jgi:colanic acid/amylovoran biosynthesis glycosyltransferase
VKIVHLRDQYLRVSFIYFLLKGFSKHRHYFLCREIIKQDITAFPYDKIYKTNILFYPLWILNKFFIRFLNNNNRLLNDWQAYYLLIKKIKNVDVIHAHMGPQGYYAIPLANKLNVPLFVTFYGSDMSDVPKLPGWMDKYNELFSVAAKVIVEGKFMKSKMVELGCPSNKVKVVKIGVPMDHLTFQYRPKYNKNKPLQILMCANFFPKKGYLKALKALRILKGNGIKFSVKIIGDGPLKNEMLYIITEYNLNEEIQLLGKLSLKQIYQLSQSMHLFFHPSETAPDGGSEGGAPTIIIEMQALGLPIISTTHADIPNIIPIENHFLASEYDENDLVNQFAKLLNMDNWNDISNRGHDFVKTQHSNEKCSSDLEQLYTNTFGSK